MTEKAAEFSRQTSAHRWREFVKKDLVWAAAGLLMELGSSALSAAPAAFALVAGLSRKRSVSVLFGAAAGALLHGFPAAFIGLAALIIAMAAKIIPDFDKPKIHAAISFFSAVLACFFSRIAEAKSTSELLILVISALTAGAFALCVSLLETSAMERGITLSDPRDRALVGIISALVFFSLGQLDYTYINIGRLLMGTTLLCVIERKGLVWGAAIGLPAVFGLCAASPEMGAAGACMAFAAAASCAFSRHGKITRAIGFVFLMAAGTLVSHNDEGSWRIFAETLAAALMYVVLPLDKMKPAENDFSDSEVSLIIRERLNFAADALEGVGAGITAAADALDKKYSFNIEGISDRAADKVCRSCPKSMVCWGRKYELFRKEFSRLVMQLRTGFELTEYSLSPECAEECVNPAGVAKAISAEYSRYISAMSDERRIRELRRIYTDRLAATQEILREISRSGLEARAFGKNRTAEKRVEKVLSDNGVEFPQAFVTKDRRGKIHIEAYGATEPRVERDYLGTVLGKTLGRELEMPEISGSGGRYRITASEVQPLSAKIGSYQLPQGQNKVCGDCCESFTDAEGALYVVLSDGMGTGSRARVDSAIACSVLSKLIKAGIPLPSALETVNTTLLVKSADESFATMDICKINLDSGECAVYKAGAATTYIKSANKLIRAAISSPPAGSGGRMSVPAQRFKVSAGDVIIMATDGAVIDEQWLSRELSREAEPKALSERIAKAARSAENGARDDISVVAVAVAR
ncbi:MAG: SpoIIE family protein phosphatase [Oscillospiraceae bacterium]